MQRPVAVVSPLDLEHNVALEVALMAPDLRLAVLGLDIVLLPNLLRETP